jgi:hypothetical protein
MTYQPCTASRAAVLHALATAAQWRPSNAVPLDKVVASVRPPPYDGDGELRPFMSMVAESQAEWCRTVVPDVLLDLALDGLTDLAAHVSGLALLTDAGLAASDAGRRRRNVTTAWFDRFMTRAQYDALVKYVARKARHSRDDSEVREFVHDYVVSVGFRDALHDRILSGHEPTAGSIRAWVWKQALSTFRNEGTDAQTRTVKGAKTERDLRNETPDEAFQCAVDGPTAAVYESPEGSEGEGGTFASSRASSGSALIDVVDPSPLFDDVVEHQAALARGMARFEDAVRCYKPNAAERYVRVLGHLAQGFTPSEVAAAEHVSPARAATLISEVRAAGRHRANIDRVRVAVIRYVIDEPMSTLSDLVGDLRAERGDIASAVSELLTEGLVATRRGGSLEVTRLGISCA